MYSCFSVKFLQKSNALKKVKILCQKVKIGKIYHFYTLDELKLLFCRLKSLDHLIF